MMDTRISSLGLIIALVAGLLIGYFAMPEKEVIRTSTVPVTTTLTSVTTTTLTTTRTSRYTTTRTIWRTVTETVSEEKSGNTMTTTSTTLITRTAKATQASTANYDLCTFGDYSGTSKVKLEVLKVVRGESAKDAVKYANMFNKKAPEGYEYILINVRVTLLSGERFSVNPLFDFKMEAKGRLVRPEIIVYPRNMPMLESSELLPGGSTSGWLAFIIPAGTPAKLHLEPLMKESYVGCWVDLGS